MKNLKLENPIDAHLKPVKTDETNTSLEISTEKIRVKNLEVTGTMTGDIIHTGTLTIDADSLVLDSNDGITKFYLAGDTDDLCTLTVAANGATTIATNDADGALGHIGFNPDGNIFMAQPVSIKAGQPLYFDGTDGSAGDTLIYQESADMLTITVGGDAMFNIREAGNSGNELIVKAGTCITFEQQTDTYNATNTNVYFNREGQKHIITLLGNTTNLNLVFPQESGNFVLLVKQDGTGSRTVTNYNAVDSTGADASGSATIKFPSGTNPTLTTDANHVDIFSFYWDAENEIAYGVATLDFQF